MNDYGENIDIIEEKTKCEEAAEFYFSTTLQSTSFQYLQTFKVPFEVIEGVFLIRNSQFFFQ